MRKQVTFLDARWKMMWVNLENENTWVKDGPGQERSHLMLPLIRGRGLWYIFLRRGSMMVTDLERSLLWDFRITLMIMSSYIFSLRCNSCELSHATQSGDQTLRQYLLPGLLHLVLQDWRSTQIRNRRPMLWQASTDGHRGLRNDFRGSPTKSLSKKYAGEAPHRVILVEKQISCRDEASILKRVRSGSGN